MSRPATSILAVSLLCVSVQAQTCGDCDGNTILNILDSLLAAQIAAALVIPDPVQLDACDVDSSLSVTVLDSLLLSQEAAGLAPGLACPGFVGTYNVVGWISDWGVNGTTEAIYDTGSSGAGLAVTFRGGGTVSTVPGAGVTGIMTHARGGTISVSTVAGPFDLGLVSYTLQPSGALDLVDTEGPQSGILGSSRRVLAYSHLATTPSMRVNDFFVGLWQGTGLNDSSLSGDYHRVGRGLELATFQAQESVLNMQTFTRGTFTFDGAGGITVGSGAEFSSQLAQNEAAAVATVTGNSGTYPAASWSYSVGPTGQVQFTEPGAGVHPGAMSGDGEMAAFVLFEGGATDVTSELNFLLRSGSGMTLASLNGTYDIIGHELEFFLGSGVCVSEGVTNAISRRRGTAAFDGAGNMIWGPLPGERTGVALCMPSPLTVGLFTNPAAGSLENWTYSVGPTGLLTLNDGAADHFGAVSATGDVLAFVVTENALDAQAQDIFIAVRR